MNREPGGPRLTLTFFPLLANGPPPPAGAQGHTYPCCVGTPSRVLDFVKSSVLTLSFVTFLAMDEYDHLCGKGFLKDCEEVARMVPGGAVMVGVSATGAGHLGGGGGRRGVIKPEFHVDVKARRARVEEVRVGRGKECRSLGPLTHSFTTLTRARQFVVSKSGSARLPWLRSTVERLTRVGQVIVFAATREDVDRLADAMGMARVHGGMTQGERESAMRLETTGW